MVKRILLVGSFFFIVVILLLVSFGFYFDYGKKPIGKNAPLKRDTNIPIIAIHGTNGGLNSFKPIKEMLLKENKIKGELEIVVNKDNSINVIGNLDKSSKHPFISIAFVEKEAEPDKWRIGLENILQKIKETYHYKQVDVIGYSNGGLAILEYLEQNPKPKNVSEVRRLITVGAPFNGVDLEKNKSGISFDDITSKSPELEAYLKFKGNIPSAIKVLAAGSNIKDGVSDGTVPIESALASRLIFKKQVKAYREIVLTTPKATHDNLSSLPEVSHLIDQFFIQSTPIDDVKINTN